MLFSSVKDDSMNLLIFFGKPSHSKYQELEVYMLLNPAIIYTYIFQEAL